MQKIKKFIILFIIILIIIISMLIILMKINTEQDSTTDGDEIEELQPALQEVKDISQYYEVKDCVEKYYLYYKMTLDAENYYNLAFDVTDISKEDIKKYKEENAKILYNILDEQFIREKEVTVDNIESKLNDIEMSIVNITNIYISEKNNNINVFFVEGLLKGEITQQIKDFQIIVKKDTTNKTFSIIPQQYIEEKYNNIEIGKEPEIEVQEKIEVNVDNIYESKQIDEEKYIKDLFSKLKIEIEHFPKVVYERLDKEYRNKKYDTFEKFQEYLNKNKQQLLSMKIDGYKKQTTEEYTQHLCLDYNDNYFIFREKAIMNYSLILDVYTVDLPEIVEKYDSSKNNEKIVINIGKLIEATKNEDYEYVYNKMNATFKANNYKTLEDFEKIIKEKFNPKEDSIEYLKYEEIAGVHIYNIEVTDESKNKIINAKVIMQLKENRDFEFSFNVEN